MVLNFLFTLVLLLSAFNLAESVNANFLSRVGYEKINLSQSTRSILAGFRSSFQQSDQSAKLKQKTNINTDCPDRDSGGKYKHVRNAAQRVGVSVVRIDGERDAPPAVSINSFDQLQPDIAFKVAGSGLVMDADGYILTNSHVVDQTRKLSVTLANGRTFKATTIQCDELTDLAVLKVDTKGKVDCELTPAPLGDSSKLHSGDCVVAVGCPVGLDFTVTSGVVSNPRRSAAEIGAHHMKGSFIQTDAALNSGNSGGPLVNDLGEVVGINSMGLTNTQAIGFAIPINRAKEIYKILKTGKKPAHPYFGVEISSITPDTVRIHNEDPNVPHLCETQGSLINRVAPGSPADCSGLRRHDIIVSVNGASVRRAEETEDCLERCLPGCAAQLGVVRGEAGTQMNFEVKPLDIHTMFAQAQKKLLSQLPARIFKPPV